MILDDISKLKSRDKTLIRIKCDGVNCSIQWSVKACSLPGMLKRNKPNLCKKCLMFARVNPMHDPEVMKNYTPPMLGRHHSQETKDKIKKSNTGRKYPQHCGSNNQSLKPGVREKIKNTIQERYGGSPLKGIKRPEHSLRMSGDKHPRWLVPEERAATLQTQIRTCLQYRNWRKLCLKRDNYLCQNPDCIKMEGRIIVDHIYPFHLLLKENNIKTKEDAIQCPNMWNIENGKTLCEKCHKQTDTFGGRAVHYEKK